MFALDRPNMFLSGGWDCTMFLWDVRMNKSVSSIFGPCISGDSIDTHNNLILTGSYRDINSLELYDLRSINRLCEIDTKTITGE